ncbi:MAG: hypothetical protein ABIS29_12810, partial [Vicinamibacterales bacterium]
RSAVAPPGHRSEPSTMSSQVEPIVDTAFDALNAEISPDGRYIAYQSNESGRHEVYVRPFPAENKGQWQVSSGGGTRPAWARNGRELFYLDQANKLTTVPVERSAATFALGIPALVLNTAYAGSIDFASRTYDVSPDGLRFLMIKDNVSGAPKLPGIIVVLNWFTELQQRVPTR